MLIKHITGATRTIGKRQGSRALPLRDEPINCTVNGPNTPSMVTAWEPTPEEIKHISNGGTIYLRLLGTAHPPVMLWAEEKKNA